MNNKVRKQQSEKGMKLFNYLLSTVVVNEWEIAKDYDDDDKFHVQSQKAYSCWLHFVKFCKVQLQPVWNHTQIMLL